MRPAYSRSAEFVFASVGIGQRTTRRVQKGICGERKWKADLPAKEDESGMEVQEWAKNWNEPNSSSKFISRNGIPD